MGYLFLYGCLQILHSGCLGPYIHIPRVCSSMGAYSTPSGLSSVIYSAHVHHPKEIGFSGPTYYQNMVRTNEMWDCLLLTTTSRIFLPRYMGIPKLHGYPKIFRVGVAKMPWLHKWRFAWLDIHTETFFLFPSSLSPFPNHHFCLA